MHNTSAPHGAASSRGAHLNTGNGPTFQVLDIGHADYMGVVEPDTAFWSLIRKEKVGEALCDGAVLSTYHAKRAQLAQEMKTLRGGLRPSAVYFNPTERCNLDCSYCYIPSELRRDGADMGEDRLLRALSILRQYFREGSRAGDDAAGRVLPGRLPQVIFHGSEPMLARDAVFSGIKRFAGDFSFGVQTNGTLLDDDAIDFLTDYDVGIGLSLDGHVDEVGDATRRNWAGDGTFAKVADTLGKLKGYANHSVICTVTTQNMAYLGELVDFLHAAEVPVAMLNPVRCTRAGARAIKPDDHELAPLYLAALERSHELYQRTGRKLVIANFANVLVGIMAPPARRLMCDISPCGGGRCFFAVGARGDLYPCSEFLGVPQFSGGNLFDDDLELALQHPAFQAVTGRRVEDIEPCSRCAVRHFCGSPCPAEAHEVHGGMRYPGAFCELYEEQVRYALRLIADGREGDFLWDDWDAGTSTTLRIESLEAGGS